MAQGVHVLSLFDIRRFALGGLIPLFVGIRDIYDSGTKESLKVKNTGFRGVLGTTLANGSDNIVIYVAFFLKSPTSYSLISMLGVFFVMTIVRLYVSQVSAKHTYLHVINPYLLILMGIYIMSGLITLF